MTIDQLYNELAATNRKDIVTTRLCKHSVSHWWHQSSVSYWLTGISHESIVVNNTPVWQLLILTQSVRPMLSIRCCYNSSCPHVSDPWRHYVSAA